MHAKPTGRPCSKRMVVALCS
uniref:Uncharacterized protein n=1 Tax=Arundo donax TaxID=35708 RepID=A0A0A9F2N6_ARUDO